MSRLTKRRIFAVILSCVIISSCNGFVITKNRSPLVIPSHSRPLGRDNSQYQRHGLKCNTTHRNDAEFNTVEKAEAPQKLKSSLPNNLKTPLVALSLLPLTVPSLAHAAGLLPAATTATLPLLPTIATCCILPTLLGFYKNEYGVSYGYGLSVASSSLVALSLLPAAAIDGTPLLLSIATCHALTTLFYGTRLSLFLLYREVTIPRFREFRERIEKRAMEKGGRLSRAPFIFSCAFLYACLVAPLFVTSVSSLEGSGGSPLAMGVYGASVALSFAGFLLNAVGDLTKTIIKMKEGEKALVTQGVYALFRHPNYTGEQFAWTFNVIAGIASLFAFGTTGGVIDVVKNPIVWASVVGWMGIEFVLCGATKGLEKRQEETFGETEEYKSWVAKTWPGFML